MPPKFTIKDMQGIAEARGGKCLSTEYVNSNTHLEWECSEGHHWETTPLIYYLNVLKVTSGKHLNVLKVTSGKLRPKISKKDDGVASVMI
jgi:hypothetical protein